MRGKKSSKVSKKKQTVRYAVTRKFIRDEGIDYVTTFNVYKSDAAAALGKLMNVVDTFSSMMKEFESDRSLKRKIARRDVEFTTLEILDGIANLDEAVSSMRDVVDMIEVDLIPLMTKRSND